MLTFSDWEKLTEGQQIEQLSALMITCQHDDHYIYRPIKMIPDLFSAYTDAILKEYPNGESTEILQHSDRYKMYQFLYTWITGGCISCYNHSIVWDIVDNSFLYYCRYCGEKKQIYNL